MALVVPGYIHHHHHKRDVDDELHHRTPHHRTPRHTTPSQRTVRNHKLGEVGRPRERFLLLVRLVEGTARIAFTVALVRYIPFATAVLDRAQVEATEPTTGHGGSVSPRPRSKCVHVFLTNFKYSGKT